MEKEPKVIKLPPSGPAPGQSVEAWLKNKQRAEDAAIERGRWKQLRSKKGEP